MDRQQKQKLNFLCRSIENSTNTIYNNNEEDYGSSDQIDSLYSHRKKTKQLQNKRF